MCVCVELGLQVQQDPRVEAKGNCFQSADSLRILSDMNSHQRMNPEEFGDGLSLQPASHNRPNHVHRSHISTGIHFFFYSAVWSISSTEWVLH